MTQLHSTRCTKSSVCQRYLTSQQAAAAVTAVGGLSRKAPASRASYFCDSIFLQSAGVADGRPEAAALQPVEGRRRTFWNDSYLITSVSPCTQTLVSAHAHWVCWRATTVVLITQTISVLDDILPLSLSPLPSPSHLTLAQPLSYRQSTLSYTYSGRKAIFLCGGWLLELEAITREIATRVVGRSVGTTYSARLSRYRCPIIASLTANWSIFRPNSYAAVTSTLHQYPAAYEVMRIVHTAYCLLWKWTIFISNAGL